MKMITIDNVLIAELKRSQKELVKRYHFQDFAIEHQAMVNKIYRRGNTNITGSDAFEFETALKQLNKLNKVTAAQVLEEYQNEIIKVTELTVNLKFKMPGADKFDSSPILESNVLLKSKNMFQKIKFLMATLK